MNIITMYFLSNLVMQLIAQCMDFVVKMFLTCYTFDVYKLIGVF